MSTWNNDDGLTVLFGTEQAKVALGGGVASLGEERELVLDLDHSRLPAHTAGSTSLDATKNVYVPSGALITSATLIVTEAFAGSGATLTIGTEQNDGTAIDADGIDAAIALTAIDAVGDNISCDGAQVGGAALAADAFFTTNVGTATYTAGRAKLIVKYVVPSTI